MSTEAGYPPQGSINWSDVRKQLESHDQSHLLRWIPELTQDEQEELHKDIMEIDFEKLHVYYQRAKQSIADLNEKKDDRLQPLDDGICGYTSDVASAETWSRRGLQKISQGQVGVLLMAGGQGTRLGVSYPKGMYDVGLPSHKTLYQLQAERILKVQQLAQQEYGSQCTVPWYIMTSEYTRDTTIKFFKKHQYFGLSPKNVIVFEQDTLPCLDFDGKVILSNKHSIARAPNGNGGLYSSLIKPENNILEDMKRRGVTCIHVYGVDNILVKMADPVFIGFCDEKEAECGAKVVPKNSPSEKVGVVCILDGKYQVVEYSEISNATSELRNLDGSLTFSAGNICNHYFTIPFLEQVCLHHHEQLIHHVATKKIPFVNDAGQSVEPVAPNGMKLEKFVFDVFQFSQKFAVLNVERNDEFSPLKNAPGAPRDCPETCRDSLMALHYRHIIAAGGVVDSENGTTTSSSDSYSSSTHVPRVVCEISPRVSYFGEGLDMYCKGTHFKQPVILDRNTLLELS